MNLADRYLSCGLDCCWLCGAEDGDYDHFVKEHIKLCFSEPVDSRLSDVLGFQVKCSFCVATAPTSRKRPITTSLSMQSPRHTLWIGSALG